MRKTRTRFVSYAALGLLAFASTHPCAVAQAPFTTDVIKVSPAPKQSANDVAPPQSSPWASLAPQLAAPPQPGDDVAVRHIDLRSDGRRAEIVLTLARRTVVSAFVLDNPQRVVIDGDGFQFEGTTENLARGRSLLKAPRFGALTPSTGRLLFDAAGPVRVVSVVGTTRDAVHVTITVAQVPRGQSAESGAPLVWGTAAPPPSPGAPLASSANRAGLPIVLIDPGHGGIDPGAVTDQGVLEKDVVLAVSLRLRALLDARGRVQPILTREGDETVRLDDRVAAARAHKANLFISLHADTYAGQGSTAVRGGSVYVLGAQASNAAARALADKENTADARAGIAGADGPDLAVDSILADLTMRETNALSHTLQGALVQNLRRSILLAREPARAAAFRVLKQAETPAVLIELGYMSNSQDVALLQSPEWQSAVAARIADAVDIFVSQKPGQAAQR